MSKILTPPEQLEAKHLADSETRRRAIDAATKDVRDAETMLADAKVKVAGLQREHINASFAFDAERARLETEAKAKAA